MLGARGGGGLHDADVGIEGENHDASAASVLHYHAQYDITVDVPVDVVVHIVLHRTVLEAHTHTLTNPDVTSLQY